MALVGPCINRDRILKELQFRVYIIGIESFCEGFAASFKTVFMDLLVWIDNLSSLDRLIQSVELEQSI